MWDKQFEQASWNGTPFNILKTVRDGGKRLQVVELPYKDDPSIWILGGKAKGYKIDAVFVGNQSLKDANEFESLLDANPAGTLEHPYLGELDLVYKTSSMSFSTKKGVVTLSLTFVKQGVDITIPISAASVDLYTQEVVRQSTELFVTSVKEANINQLNELKAEATTFLNTLRIIANQMQRPGVNLAAINNQISDGLSAISTIYNAPSSFAKHLNSALVSLTNQLNSSNDNSNTASNSVIFADKRFQRIENSVKNNHIKTLSTISSIEINRYVKNESLIEVDFYTVEAEMNNLISRLKKRLTESTAQATYESYDLVVSLNNVDYQLGKRFDQFLAVKNNLKITDVYTPAPALSLAHQLDCQFDRFIGFNSIRHPLFVSGKVSVTK